MPHECGKKKLDRIGAMLVLARSGQSWRRREKQMYWCPQCRAYHTTSWGKMSSNEPEQLPGLSIAETAEFNRLGEMVADSMHIQEIQRRKYWVLFNKTYDVQCEILCREEAE